MALRLLTPPTVEPISLAEAKAHLRVDGTAEDELIAALVKAARLQAEHELGRALIEQTWELLLDAFPAGEIRLSRPTVMAVSAVQYIDTAGTTQTWSATNYVLDSTTPYGWLFTASGLTWPETYASSNAVRVRFTAGYGATAADVPENVRLWIKLHVGAAYRNREAFSSNGNPAELPGRFFGGLLDSERVYL